uniref:Putative transcription factor iiia n=1 Tax=Culex tarsalis TaxID=7177 RepID=A0A1Q3EXI1_CULTA
MQVPSSKPTEYCRLCFSQHSLQNVLASFDPTKRLLTQIQNCLGLWLAPESDFPCAVCRLCASALDTFQAFRERSGECDLAIKQLRKPEELESIKMELVDDVKEDARGESDREEGALVIDEPESMNESEEEDVAPSTAVQGPVWVPVENAKTRSARYVCLECENTFSCAQTLSKHQKARHGDSGNSRCAMKKYGKGKTRHYSCGQCSAVFYGYGAALTHLAQAHKKSDEQPEQAEIITGDKTPTPTPPPAKTKPKKTLKCQQCPKMFSCMRTLDHHMRTACKVKMTQTSASVVSISPKVLRKQLFGDGESTGRPRPKNHRGTGSCFRCGVCKEVIVGSSLFLEHRRTVHGGGATGESPPAKEATGGSEA